MGEVGQTGEGLEVQDFISRASRGSDNVDPTTCVHFSRKRSSWLSSKFQRVPKG